MPQPSQSGSTLHGFTIDELDAQIQADHAEGKEKVTLTRASARAVYYAVFDVLHALESREHEPHDLARLGRVLSQMSRVGWPE